MFHLTRRVTFLLTPFLLAGCVAIGPTVPVTPGAGRSQAAFGDDRRACMALTDQQVQPVANRAATASLTGRQGGMTTADLQRLYDADYGQCMSARGNSVGLRSAGPRFPSESLQTATDLTDPDSMSARQALQEVVTSSQASCPGERIVVTVTDAPLASSTKARLVALSTPYGGGCFGQPGQNTYLVAKHGPGWTRLLSAEPGSIDLLPTAHRGYGDVQMNSLGLCTYRYAWDGSRYTQVASDQCITSAPPTVGTLALAMRRGNATPDASTFACPASSEGRPQSRFSGTLFQGDPAQQMSLAPNGTKPGRSGPIPAWTLPAGGEYVLACHYTGVPDILLPLGVAAHVCQQDGASFVCK